MRNPIIIPGANFSKNGFDTSTPVQEDKNILADITFDI